MDRHAVLNHSRSLGLGVFFLLCSLVPVPTLAQEGEPHWWPGFGQSSYDGPVESAVYYEGDLIVGGSLSSIGGMAVPGCARWDGGRWYPFGDTRATALAVVDGTLYAGLADRTVAQWTGTSWERFGSVANGTVSCLIGYGAHLVVGGDFSQVNGVAARGLAQWDGAEWSAVGGSITAPTLSAANALAVYDGCLVAGGSFTHLGGLQVNNLGRWDGTSWTGFQQGANGDVRALLADGPKLYLAGEFQFAGSTAADNVACWTGTEFEGLGLGITSVFLHHVASLALFQGDLYVGGSFDHAGGEEIFNLTRWDGSKWEEVGDAIADVNRVTQLVPVEGTLYVAGFSMVGSGGSDKNLLAWDGSAWRSLGAGLNGPVNALAEFDGALIAIGGFTRSGIMPVKSPARWDGVQWTSALGGGVPQAVSFTRHDGKLIAASGAFVARWDGGAWTALGPAMSGGPVPVTVYAVAEFRGDLYAGGSFTTASGTAVNRIARWDGGAWQPLGSGLDGTVRTLAVYGDRLVAAGEFTSAGGLPAGRVAAWDGGMWTNLGWGVNGTVHTLVVHDGGLVAGGEFTQADGQTALHVARWDGSAWTPLGGGITSSNPAVFSLNALAVYGNDLIAGGLFTHAGGVAASCIARWDGTQWSGLGSGMNQAVTCLATLGNDLYAGGAFTTAGGLPAGRIARWIDPDVVSVRLLSFTTRWVEGGAVIRWEIAGEEADVAAFRVYRESNGMRTLLDGEHFRDGTSYELIDRDAPEAGADYWLAEIGRDGSITWHGPSHLAARSFNAVALRVLGNPARGEAEIQFELPRTSPVSLTLYGVDGRLARRLFEGATYGAGNHRVRWNGRLQDGRAAPTGVYFVKLEYPGIGRVLRLVLLR